MFFIKSCCFIGHKNCTREIRERLLFEIEELITKKDVNCFYVGTQGNFDKLSYEVLSSLEKKYEIKINVVLAYLNKKTDNPYYDADKTIFPDELTKTPMRYAIRKRNSYMIGKADYIVSYLNTPFSNAYCNIEEAVRKKKYIINIGAFNVESIAL